MKSVSLAAAAADARTKTPHSDTKHAHKCEHMQTADPALRKCKAVYMYSISNMYSPNCYNLHVDL